MLAIFAIPVLQITLVQAVEETPVTLTRDGELYAIEVNGSKATCETWTVDATHGELRRGKLTLGYYLAHGELMIDGTRFLDGENESSSTCTAHQEVHENADWLETQGAHLFRTKERCQAAIAKKEHVAFTVPCDLTPEATYTPDEKSKARFERILDKGGVMYAVMNQEERDICRTVRFTPYAAKDRQTDFAGDVSYRVTDGRRKGTETYSWELDRNKTEMTILGPGWQWEDGEGGAMGCASFVSVTYAKTYVESFAKLHFTAAGCRKELAENQARENWYPDPETISRLGDTPLAGGC